MVYLKCSKVVSKVSDIIDGEAGLMTRIRFYGHIMMCKNCRRYLQQFRLVRDLAGKVTQNDFHGDLPEDFDRVMNFVMEEVGKEDG